MTTERTLGTLRVGAIDCGTNSIRLLVADIADAESAEGKSAGPMPTLHDVIREMVITRLGQGVDKTGKLDPEAIDRTLTVTRNYQRQVEELGVQRFRFVATSATRDAKNRDVFVNGVRDITGADPQVISGKEEARLSFTGALSALPSGSSGPYMVVDIGGGSGHRTVFHHPPRWGPMGAREPGRSPALDRRQTRRSPAGGGFCQRKDRCRCRGDRDVDCRADCGSE